MRKPLSAWNPLFYYIIVWLRKMRRSGEDLFANRQFAETLTGEPLPYRVYKHQSVLIRTLGETDLTLQVNKVTNLKIAVAKLDGILIRPGETFSFWRLVGKATKRKGYLKGMLLQNGRAVAGTGGGLCQIANLIHWLCLHSPLTVTERHHHSLDVFPDSGRVVPFGSGATLFYNYVDYRFKNATPHTFQLRFWLDKKCLNGDLRVSEELPFTYHVFEQNHAFVKVNGQTFRQNELWRRKVRKKGSGDVLETELIQKNFSRVLYKPRELNDENAKN